MIEPDVHQQRLDKFKGWLPSWLVTFTLLFIALGQFSDSIELISQAKEAIVKNFTYEPYYKKIKGVHVNSTYSHIQKLLGAAPISKQLDEDISIDFYIEKSHVIGIAHDEKRVKGFYVQALVDDFSPTFMIPSQIELRLGENDFSVMGEQISLFSLDSSRNQNFYVESFDLGQSGLSFSFIQAYSGNQAENVDMIKDLYDKELLGEDSQEALSLLRGKVKPNIYGFGKLSLSNINLVFLTESELKVFASE
ncbi:ETEC_3214 domain-containing protein [Shewanella atlantica]|uniref:Uncharacterized protein n=1 Tax=Shewanella atlantica TaxID=271099 RepID=A0A3S0KLI5_9GAMM|nr:ETEC_3214 domain-containing protein [Shewanella atlantica]RTR33210.1 hypothetical protein EKG39_05535 [Shewanella atlantica]